jgi:hypothetical protein
VTAEFLMPVGKNFEHGNFNNPVAANVHAGSFEVENNKRFGKVKLHVLKN